MHLSCLKLDHVHPEDIGAHSEAFHFGCKLNVFFGFAAVDSMRRAGVRVPALAAY